MEPEIVEQPDLQAATEEVSTSQETETTEATTETVDWEAKARELEATNKQLYARAKKAEAASKAAPETAPAKEGDLTGKDVLALTGAGITEEEDIDVIQKAAKIQGISVAEAVKDPVVQGILKGKQEERKSAAATSTGTTRRTPTERSPDILLDRAKKGELPDDPRDLERMIKARIGIK